MSVEELMDLDIEVTSVSRRPEKLSEVASAIQVITAEDIRRSSATNLPEALRLATNLQVAQISSAHWIISARGFNGVFANKLLVMIDGRTVYSPLFAGVYWDAQSVLLEDIERIEIVSGPGGTLWGANAVNGVINITTKKSGNSKGLYVSGAAGNALLDDMASFRYGGKIGSRFTYRVFAQHQNRGSTLLVNEKNNSDSWSINNGGFRMDWSLTKKTSLMLLGNLNAGTHATRPQASTFDGQNILGRWTHNFSDSSELIVQAYFDRTWRRDIPSTISDELETYDVDFQHRFPIGKRHSILWGGGYRLMKDESEHATIYIGFVPEKRDMSLYSSFVQDEIMIVPDQFKITIGTKVQHNVYTGFEIQPSGRIAFTPSHRHTIWAAVSRAVRMPSRIDVDYHLPTYPVPPSAPSVAGGPNFKSESLVAYELGYRIQPTSNSLLSLATFYNEYDDIYSVEALPGTLTYQIQNGTQGTSWGAELSGAYQIFKKWRIRGGYTYFFKELENKPGHTFDFSSLGHDAEHQAQLQSVLDLPLNFQLDITARYVGVLLYYLPDYFTFDTRLAWQYKKRVELSFVGQNLAEAKHFEFGPYIPRSFHGRVTCRF